MAKNENQLDYRAERKKRLANNAKKSSKKGIDSVKVVTWVVRAIAIVLAVGIAVFALYQFGVPQKFMPAVKVGDRTYSVAEYSYYYSSVFQTYVEQSNSLQQSYGYTLFDYTKDPAVQTTTDEDGNKITYDELFRQRVLTTLETANYYLDKCEAEGITLSDEHKAEIDELIGSIASSAEANHFSASRYISYVYGKGLNEKMFRELLEEQYLVAQYLEDVEEDCYSSFTDEELEKAYAEDPGEFQAVDLRLFGFDVEKEEEKEETTTATEETTAETSEETTVTEDTTAAEETTAEEETTDAAEEETTEAVEKEPSKTELLAEEMLGRIKDEASFIELAYEYAAEKDKETFKKDTATLAKNIKRATVKDQIGEDLAEWLYSADRKVGDKKVYPTDDYVYVIYIIKTAYRAEEPLVDARHILVSFDSVASELKKTDGNKIDVEKKEDQEVKTATTEEEIEITNKGTGYSIELVTETYKQARDIYDKYMSGEKTEEAFAKLADELSDDGGEDKNGGLYEGIEKGKMVEPFENWVYDKDRKTGDVDLVMTEYGWHVMYFVKQHEEPAWKVSARETLGSKAYAEIEEEVIKETEGTAVPAAFLGFAASEACKNADKLY